MNIQTTSPMLPSNSRVGPLVEQQARQTQGASDQATRRPTRIGRSDVHATFTYAMNASLQSPRPQHQIDEYV
ncbi:MAG: hypothetical protein RIC89_15380 [Pseudomonadales bacterium]